MIFRKKKFGYGCIQDPPDDRDYPVEAILGAPELPKNFIVPFLAHWFDDELNPIDPKVKHQGVLPSCVSQATSLQKGTQEKIDLSARFHHAYCKAIDGYKGGGTYLRTGQKVLVDYGDCEEKIYPENNQIPYSEYNNLSKITEDMRENASNFKSKSYFSVSGWDNIRRTIYTYKTPVVSGCDWYEGDNKCKGVLEARSGRMLGGHAFALIGWKDVDGYPALIMANSFGNAWGNRGIAYILPMLEHRLYPGWVTVDIEKDLAKILLKYANKNVKASGKPEIFKIEGGYKRAYLDEFSFWSNGYIFAGDVVEIDLSDLNQIPEDGYPMTFNYNHKWDARQIKELVRLCIKNPGSAAQQLSKYFK